MKITAKTIIFGILLFSVFSAVYALEKATIYFKNGDKLDCIVDRYDTGKWVDIVDETGSITTIKWDVINVVLFKNEKITLEELKQSAAPDVAEGTIEVEIETVSDSTGTDDKPMNLAQRLAKKEKERKEKEALAAKKEIKEVKKTEVPIPPKKIVAEPAVPPQAPAPTKKETTEKATIIYKNGDKLNCTIDQYEIGKYAVVIDESGNKRIVNWDKIDEVIFIKEENKPVQTTIVEPAAVPAAVTPAPVAAGSGSMLDQFKKNQSETSVETPANTKEERFKQDIREENKAEKPVFDFDKDSKKLSVDYYKTLESDATRRCWLEEGGKLLSKGYTVNYTYVSMDMSDEMPEGESEFSMHGLGYTGNMYLKFLNPPNYDMGKSSWTSMSVGFTGSFNINFGGMEYSSSGYDMTMDMTMASFELSVPLGYTFGVGQYLSRSDWKGVMLGIYWKPSFQFTSVTTTMDMDPDPWGMFPMTSDPTTDSTVNLSGLQWTIDYGSFSGMAEDLAQEAHFSISGFILPETDATPFMFSIGLGMVWY
jgi:sRNA-binding regulator protein Hfq